MAWYEVPLWEYLNLIAAEFNTEMLVDFLKSSLCKHFSKNISLEWTVVITIGVMFYCLVPDFIIFSYCALRIGSFHSFYLPLTVQMKA